MKTKRQKHFLYCQECGRKCEPVQIEVYYYDEDTGKPTMANTYKCPEARWFNSHMSGTYIQGVK